MSLIVQKYGGTSVGSIERIRTVASHIAATARAGHRVVAVVSAMGDHTDELLTLARELNPHPPQREVDMLISVGERITMALLSIALQGSGLDALSLTGSQSGILTDEVHGNARIMKILGDRIRKGLDDSQIVIIAGFQGMSANSKEITTLGRGGTDLTAIAVAHTLAADLCEIYKDVDGVFTTDPRLVPEARVLETMSWDALLEMSWAGSAVVHSRGAHLAHKFGMPLTIRSSFDWTKPGTRVTGRYGMETISVTGLAHKNGQCWMDLTAHVANAVPLALKWFWEHGETPSLCQQTRMGNDGTVSLRVVCSEERCHELLAFLGKHGEVRLDHERRGLAAITVVGTGFWQSPETVTRIIETLGEPPELFDSRNTAVTLCVPTARLKGTLSQLHAELF